MGGGDFVTLRLTARDIDLLRSLSNCVRLFSIEQIQSFWWPDTSQKSGVVEKRINKLVDGEWLNRSVILARPVPIFPQPICKWNPGTQLPNFGKCAWLTKSRWAEGHRQIYVVSAGRKASHLFAGVRPRGIRQPFQLTHDLGLSQVYLQYRIHLPAKASKWIGERGIAFRRKKGKIPDAIIGDAGAWPPELIIEFAGSYGKDRLLQFHKFCERESIPYELW